MTMSDDGFVLTTTLQPDVDPVTEMNVLYLTSEICGVLHSVHLISGRKSSPLYETNCGLPLTSEERIHGYRDRTFMDDKEYCGLCYDAVALQTLADI